MNDDQIRRIGFDRSHSICCLTRCNAHLFSIRERTVGQTAQRIVLARPLDKEGLLFVRKVAICKIPFRC